MQPLRSLPRRIYRFLNSRKPSKGPRWISEELGVEGFAAALEQKQIRYAILRWFERLPEVSPGGDLDMLVHDEDVKKVEALLQPSGAVKCDLFSVRGSKGTAYRGVSYFPTEQAATMLERTRHFGPYRVPSPEDHFLSLAYHAVFHKGPSSGLSSRHPEAAPTSSPKHDYPQILARMSQALGIDVRIDMEGLEEVLDAHGWRPSGQMISALRSHNPWVAAHFGGEA